MSFIVPSITPSIMLKVSSSIDILINHKSEIEKRFGMIYGMTIRMMTEDADGSRITLVGSSDSVNNLVRDIKKNHINFVADNGVGKILDILSYIK